MNEREEIIRLDTWLAVQVAAGVWFFPVFHGPGAPGCKTDCAINSYADEVGLGLAAAVPLPENMKRELYDANDESGGNPAAVRAELHELYPFLTELPVGEPAHVG